MDDGVSGTTAQPTDGKSGCTKFLEIVKIVARFLCLIVGLALIAVGAFLLSEVKYANEGGFALTVYGFYSIVFGILSVLAEIRHKKMLALMKYILFLTTYPGRCVFYVFVGVVVLPIDVPKVPDIGYIMGSILIAAGIVNLLIWPWVRYQDKKKARNEPDA